MSLIKRQRKDMQSSKEKNIIHCRFDSCYKW